eukprot:3855816-Rhodomonas_salina.4
MGLGVAVEGGVAELFQAVLVRVVLQRLALAHYMLPRAEQEEKVGGWSDKHSMNGGHNGGLECAPRSEGVRKRKARARHS